MKFDTRVKMMPCCFRKIRGVTSCTREETTKDKTRYRRAERETQDDMNNLTYEYQEKESPLKSFDEDLPSDEVQYE